MKANIRSELAWGSVPWVQRGRQFKIIATDLGITAEEAQTLWEKIVSGFWETPRPQTSNTAAVITHVN